MLYWVLVNARGKRFLHSQMRLIKLISLKDLIYQNVQQWCANLATAAGCAGCLVLVLGINPAHSSFHSVPPAPCLQSSVGALRNPSLCMEAVKMKAVCYIFSSRHCLSNLFKHQIIDGLELYFTPFCAWTGKSFILWFSQCGLLFLSAQIRLFFQITRKLFSESSVPLLHLLGCWSLDFLWSLDFHRQSADTWPYPSSDSYSATWASTFDSQIYFNFGDSFCAILSRLQPVLHLNCELKTTLDG